MCLLSNFTRCLAILYVVTYTLLFKGVIGIANFFIFSCALNVGGDGFCCVSYFTVKLH
jgi:hypothetical protein